MNTTLLLCAGIALASLPLRADEPVATLDAQLGLGQVSYDESSRRFPTESDWSANSSALSLAGRLAYPQIQLLSTLRLLGSSEETETWKEAGETVQRNSLQAASASLFLGAAPTPLHLGAWRIDPYFGLSLRQTAFERSDFVWIERDGISDFAKGSVTETVRSLATTGGATMTLPIDNRWSLELAAEGSWLFYSRVENDAFNETLDGDNGWSVAAEIRLLAATKKQGQHLGLSLHGEYQSLPGNASETSDVEWPKNTWQELTLALFWRAQF